MEETQKTEEKTFTQAELNAIVETRLNREKEKYADYSVLKEKASKLDALEEESKSELQKAVDRANSLESELDTLRKQNEVKEIRESVSKETGIPMHLLTGANREECEAQAKAIAEFKGSSGYPVVKDSGEVQSVSKGSTREQFAQWASEALN